jgi:predicted glycosyltransferase
LLEAFSLPYEVWSGIGGGISGLAREMAVRTAKLAATARRFRPDLLLGIMGPSIAPIGRLLSIPSWVFYDTETARVTNSWVYPMCSRLFVPDAYTGGVPRGKTTRYAGTHELAYLHPSRFAADPSVRAEAGIGPDEPFAVVRIVSWEASHDVGDSGFVDATSFVQWLSKRLRVVVSGERGVPDAIRPFALRMPPHRIHHLLAEAHLYVGEGATMAAEAAVLGTPSAFVHTAELGYMQALERMGLLLNTPSQERARVFAEEVTADLLGARARWADARSRMLREWIDVSGFVIDAVRDAVRSRG